MEDQVMEWENKGHDENGGNMTWILSKGLAVGKKMLITGVVISSAPVILPPLMVISTIGLVCAVPYGLFLASYACTQTLIAKLLPIPKAFPVTHEDFRAKNDYDEYGGDVDMVNVEEELRQRVDMRLKQDEKANEEGVNNKNEFDEKNGYAEDVLAKEDEKPTEETRGVMIVIEGEDENGSSVKEELSHDVTIELANDEQAKETTGLLEKIRDEGSPNEGPKKGQEGTEKGLKGTDRNIQQTVKQSKNGNGGSSKNNKANRVKQNRKAKKADAREVADESRIDLLDDKKTASPDCATPEGNKKPGLKDTGSLEVTVPPDVTAPGSGGTASKERGDDMETN